MILQDDDVAGLMSLCVSAQNGMVGVTWTYKVWLLDVDLASNIPSFFQPLTMDSFFDFDSASMCSLHPSSITFDSLTEAIIDKEIGSHEGDTLHAISYFDVSLYRPRILIH